MQVAKLVGVADYKNGLDASPSDSERQHRVRLTILKANKARQSIDRGPTNFPRQTMFAHGIQHRVGDRFRAFEWTQRWESIVWTQQ